MSIFRRTKLARSYHNFIRYKEIVGILLKHGFHDFVEHSKLIKSLQLRKYFFKEKLKERRPKLPFTHYERIRLAVEELGPTFIKLGQFLSNRPDLIPSELCAEFEKLLEHAPPFSSEVAIRIFEKSLGVKIKDVFREFDRNPFSSASIAQVHVAKFKDGTKVAVKIERPGIKQVIESDLEIMSNLAVLLKKHITGTDAIDPISIVEEFDDDIHQELDFGKEILNIEKFSKVFAEEPDLVVPKVYKEYSNKEIITMEFIEGEKFSSYEATDEQINSICEKFANLVLKQIFETGYFHADPHAGNVIITPDQKICFIDFGLMGLLPPKHKSAMCEIIVGLVDHDPDITTRAIISLSFNKEVENRPALEHQAFKIMEHYGYLPIEDINIGHFLRDLLKLLVVNHLKIPTDIFLLLKALISLEGTVRKIKPNFDMISHVEPFVKRMLYRNRSPYSIIREFYKSSLDYSKLLSELPSEIRELLYQFKNKTFKLQFEHKGLDPLLDKHDKTMNRLSFSIVTASMLIGSSLMLKAHVPPIFEGLSLPGIVVFAFSILMGLLLFLTILRHEKM